MFSRVKNFLIRHKRKFVVGSIIIGSLVFLTRYTRCKFREWQEREVRNILEKTKKYQHFESIEKTCNQMILSLASTLRESVVKTLNTKAIVNKLRSGCNDKVACWNELKVLAIARSAVIIYSHAMLVILVRIQLSLMGGHMYKNAQGLENITQETETIQTKYMSLSSYFMYDGIKKLSSFIRSKVEEITASMSLKDELVLRDLQQVYWAIMSSISANNAKDPIKNLAEYMLPPNCEKEEVPTLSKLISESLDLLESEEVRNLMQHNIRSGFVLLVDHISEYFTGPEKSNSQKKNGMPQNGISIPGTSNQKDISETCELESCYMADFVDINKVTMPVAKIIPIINGQVPDKPTPKDIPTDWLQSLILNDELKLLGANIYEAFSA